MRINYNEPDPLLRRIPVYLYDISRQPVEGATPTGAQIQLSKTGNGWFDAGGTWVEDVDGLYYYIATQSETATNSFLWLKVIWPGAERVSFPVQINDRIEVNQPDPCKRRIPIYLTDVTNTPITGLNLNGASQTQLSKNGAAAVDVVGVVQEIGEGAYYYELDATEVDTLGYDVIKVFPTGLPNTRYVYAFNIVEAATPTPIASTITIAIVSPSEGSLIGRATPLQFTVTGTAPFRRVWVSAQLGGSTVEETVHDGIAFAPIYLGGGNSRSNVTIGPESGYLFNVLRLGGWRGSSVTLKIIAVDVNGTLGYKIIGNPLALYTWQIAGGGDGDVTPFVGQGGA